MVRRVRSRRESPHLPTSAPTAMTLVWRLGVLSARHLASLWPHAISERGVRYILEDLVALGYLFKDPDSCLYAPFNSFLLEGGAGRANWEYVYTATPAGIRYVAEYLELSKAEARTRYRRTYHPYRHIHAYLRNEAYAVLASDPGSGWRLRWVEGEGGVGRVRLPDRLGRGPRWVEPDGLMMVEEGETASSYWDCPALTRPDPLGCTERTVFVEADTGSQSHVEQIAQKLDGYSEWYLAGGSATSDLDVSHCPAVLFVSPERARSKQVKRFVKHHVQRNPRCPLIALDSRLRKNGHRDGALGVFCTADLQTLRRGEAWESFSYLRDRRPGPL